MFTGVVGVSIFVVVGGGGGYCCCRWKGVTFAVSCADGLTLRSGWGACVVSRGDGGLGWTDVLTLSSLLLLLLNTMLALTFSTFDGFCRVRLLGYFCS